MYYPKLEEYYNEIGIEPMLNKDMLDSIIVSHRRQRETIGYFTTQMLRARKRLRFFPKCLQNYLLGITE
jgi:hypothetical protein